MANAFNPFRPGDPVRPDMFVGRQRELKKLEKKLFQTLRKNPQSFIIQGERGIGKSSLLLYLSRVARGSVKPILYRNKFSFLCISVSLGGCKSQLQIVQRIAKGIKSQLLRKKDSVAVFGKFWDFLTNWEILGVKYTPNDTSPDALMAMQDLMQKLDSFLSRVDGIDGAVILIDEAHRAPSSAGLGELIKETAEFMSNEDYMNIVFGLAGLPQLIDILRESHPSSPRKFDVIPLGTLDFDSRDDVLSKGIARSNLSSSTKLSINPTALEFLCDLSEGYPHFLQQFAFSAFEANEDDVIDMDDVIVGTYGEDGAMDQLGQKYFNEMYEKQILSDNYRLVLDTMAEHGDEWSKKVDITSESQLEEHIVTSALKRLRQLKTIQYDDSRQGYYRLPTKSFAAWIRANSKMRKEELVMEYPEISEDELREKFEADRLASSYRKWF